MCQTVIVFVLNLGGGAVGRLPGFNLPSWQEPDTTLLYGEQFSSTHKK